MTRSIRSIALIGAAALFIAGCDSMSMRKDNKDAAKCSSQRSTQCAAKCSTKCSTKCDVKSEMKSDASMPMQSAVATITPSRAATTQPINNNVMGTVTFMQDGESVKVMVSLSGFEPNSTHGIHIHEKADLSDPELKSAGGHFNPDHHKHGGPMSGMAHAGDLGNITADANGNVNTTTTVKGITLDKGDHGIMGRSVVIHAKSDDLMSDPAGNSGARIAAGVVEAKS